MRGRKERTLILVFFFLGCATIEEPLPLVWERERQKDNKDAGKQQNVAVSLKKEDKKDNLKIQLQKLREEVEKLRKENLSLKEELNKKKEIITMLRKNRKVIVRMPTAKEIQTALKNAGVYKGKVDGVIGVETKQAIREFQKAHGLTPDGVVGSKTWEKLRDYISIEK